MHTLLCLLGIHSWRSVHEKRLLQDTCEARECRVCRRYQEKTYADQDDHGYVTPSVWVTVRYGN